MQDAPSDPAIPLYRFHAHMGRWQTLAIQVTSEPNRDVDFAAIRNAIEEAPREGTLADRLISRCVLNEILARLVRRGGLERDPDVGTALLALLTSCRSEDWRREALALLEHCAMPNVPLLVRRALKMLDERYRGRDFDESALASALVVSTSHLRHQLTKYTGRSVEAHLHLRRTSEAFPRIRQTRDTFDAIATAVGFSDETQLRRHIQRRFGMTPRELRMGQSASGNAPSRSQADV